MKFFGLLIPDWIVLVGIVLTILYWYMIWNFGYWEKRNIPCPKPILFFGNLLSERNKKIRDEDIRKHKLYGSVYGFYEGRRPTIRIGDPDMLKEILTKQFDHFTDRRKIDLGSGNNIVKKFLTLVNGKEWRLIRNVMTPTFTSGKLKQMGPLIEEAIADLVEILQEKANSKSSVDLKGVFGPLTMDIIATCAFGMRINSQKDPEMPFVKYVNNLIAKRNFFRMLLSLLLPAFIRNFFKWNGGLNEETIQFLKSAITETMHCRKEKKVVRNDFLQLMLEAQVEDNAEVSLEDRKKVLTEDGVVAQSILFLLAGFETISTALAIVCYQLAISEDVQEKLSQEIDSAFSDNKGNVNYEILQKLPYLDMVLKESLRWFSPAFRTERECVKDAQVGDILIKKGTLVSIPIHAIHYDEKYYPNPEKFDPERFSSENSVNQYAYLPFGNGPRNCIGMRFAILEAKYILAHLVHHFKLLRCPETKEPLDIGINKTTLTPAAGAWVRFEKK